MNNDYQLQEQHEEQQWRVYSKLQKARVLLQEQPLKKSGFNSYAGFKYFELGDFLKQDRDSNFPGENTVKDKVIKWSLPVEEQEDGEYYITLPDDLLETTNFNEGDQIEWISQDNGSYLLKKVEVKN